MDEGTCQKYPCFKRIYNTPHRQQIKENKRKKKKKEVHAFCHLNQGPDFEHDNDIPHLLNNRHPLTKTLNSAHSIAC